LTHIHAAILEGAFRFYREEYETLKRFMEDFPTVIDEGVKSFAREMEFYLTYLRYMRRVMERDTRSQYHPSRGMGQCT